MSYTERLTLLALSLGIALTLLILVLFPSGLQKACGLSLTIASLFLILWCRDRIMHNAKVITRALESGQELVDQSIWYFNLLDRLRQEEGISDTIEAKKVVNHRVFAARLHLEVDNTLKGNLH